LDPRDLYWTGELSACVRATVGAASVPRRILHVRALLRLGRYAEALRAIANVAPSNGEDAALLRALESSCHSLQGSAGLARGALLGVAPGTFGLDTRYEIAHARMLVGWVEGAPDAMEAALSEVDVASCPHLYGHWLFSRSWVASLRGEYVEQLRFLQRAAAHVATVPAAKDISLLANATRSMIHLVREISAKGTFEFGVQTAESIPWTHDLEVERFLTFRGLAWAYALRGGHEKAFHYAYFARDIAPSVMWVTASYADQAYLARMADENSSADALLRHAVACARETDWTTTGEERIALLSLVELLADRDPATGRDLLATYDAIPVALSPRFALARDRRLFAMEEYARGSILAALGERSPAADLLADAYERFRTIHYAWRAAASALRLHSLTGEAAWMQRASEAVAEFPESSVADAIRKQATGVEDARIAALTPAQRRVFGLICQGLTDKQVAQTLGISPETAKNHAARIRATFGVHSRAALIAATRREAV
jgi:DNA-binding CsgD family transcriptional regulator/tetratricopeptide (TPR) repeat protein